MKRNSWLARYFTSYLMVGVLPVLVLGLVFYFTTSMALEREARSVNYMGLNDSLDQLDGLLESMNEMSENLSETLNEYIDFYTSTLSERVDLSALEQDVICQRLASYEDSFGVPVQIVLFLRGDTYLYTSDGRISYAVFEETFRDQADLTMSRFYTLLSTLRHKNSFRLVTQSATNKAVYLYPIPRMGMLPQATVGFIFSDEQLKALFDNYLGENSGSLYIYNDYLNQIFSYEAPDYPSGMDEQEELASMKGTGAFEGSARGKGYVLTRSVPGTSGYSAVMVTQENQFYGHARLMRSVLGLSALLLLVIGIMLAFYMSRRVYSPIKNLVASVVPDEKSDDWSENEFELLQEHYRRISDRNIEISDVLDRQRPMVVYSCLDNLLHNNYLTDEQRDFALKCAHIKLDERYLFVLLIQPEGERIAQENPGGQQIQLLISAAEELAVPGVHLYVLEQMEQRCLAVLANTDRSEENGVDIRLAVARQMQTRIKQACGLNTRLAGGGIYESIQKINASYMEASVVLSDYLGFKRGAIALIEDVISKSDQNYQYPVVEQAYYIQSLKQADERAALQAVDEMVQKIASNGSFLITKCLCYDIVNMMIKLSSQLGGGLRPAEIKALCRFDNLDEFLQQVRQITCQICRQYKQLKEVSNNKLKNDLIEYVNANFCDAQLSLERMAEHFELSQNYLSRFFKQETGYNFIQYVSFLRMERVKEELASGNRQIKDIVLSVGYMDVASFVRKFKAYEGITPGQYREKMRARGQDDPPVSG